MILDPKLKEAQRKLTDKVMGRAGITGTAIGEQGGKPCLKVYVEDEKAGKHLPKRIGGFPVVVEVTGSFRRL